MKRQIIFQKKDFKKEIKKIEKPQVLPDLTDKFRKVFEICGDEIISYLNKKDQINLRSGNKQHILVSRVTFYMVQSF